MKAWHFVGDTLRNGGPIPADGELLAYNGNIKMCESGLHASIRLIDALKYAPGSTICRVDCDTIMEKGNDKLVCGYRTILWRVGGEELLRKFARLCALDVVDAWDCPSIVLQWLRGDFAAESAAWSAAEFAAWSAAKFAAESAAESKQNARLVRMVRATHNG